MGEAGPAARIILSFIIALVIISMTAKMIGEERKNRFFKKRQRTTVFCKRGPLGEQCHFGVPCNWQGVVIAVLMFGSIGLIGYLLIFAI